MEMILVLVALITAVVVSCWALKFGVDGYTFLHSFTGLVGAGGLVACLFALIVYCFAAWGWFASEYKAEILNAEYGTNYSAKQVFFASDVIDTVRELDRKRVEVNGDLFRDQPDEEN